MNDLMIAPLRLHYGWLTIGWLLVGLVVFLSLTSEPLTPIDFQLSDKFAHLLAYFTLQFWFAQLYPQTRQRAYWFVVLLLLGVSIEGLQGLIPHRFMEWADLLANSLGLVLGWLLASTPLGFSLLWLEQRLGLHSA